jgi:hypothetical protein
MAITRVQYATSGSDADALDPCLVSLSATPTVGNLLIAVCSINTNTLSFINSITQTGVTWTQAVQVVRTASYALMEIWTGTVDSAPGTSLSIGMAGYAYIEVAVIEYSGLLTTGFLDKTATGTGSSTSPDTGTTVATTQADELWIGGYAPQKITTLGSLTNGFSYVAGRSNTTPNKISVFATEKIVSTTGTANNGGTFADSCGWAAAIATFKASAATPPAVPDDSTVDDCIMAGVMRGGRFFS